MDTDADQMFRMLFCLGQFYSGGPTGRRTKEVLDRRHQVALDWDGWIFLNGLMDGHF